MNKEEIEREATQSGISLGNIIDALIQLRDSGKDLDDIIIEYNVIDFRPFPHYQKHHSYLNEMELTPNGTLVFKGEDNGTIWQKTFV